MTGRVPVDVMSGLSFLQVSVFQLDGHDKVGLSLQVTSVCSVMSRYSMYTLTHSFSVLRPSARASR